MSSTIDAPEAEAQGRRKETLETVVVRFCGDSGDGMQLVGTQMTNVSAAFGNDVSTLPDFPAEIRAPAGTLAGVSGYQLCFSNHDIFTPGDAVDTLVAMNPAALKTNVEDLKRGGTLIVNEDEFDKGNLTKAQYLSNPLAEGDVSLQAFRIHKVPMTRLTRDAVDGLGLTVREADRCKNFFALGLIYWLYERDSTATENWVKHKFGKKPEIMEANLRALRGGYNYGFSTEAFTVHYEVPPAKLPAGRYRKLTGNEATALGFVTAAKLAGKRLFYAGYPITPASDILHELAPHKNFGVRTLQAEDEIAAMSAAVGAAFAGELAITASSGPGICLKGEAMGLGMITELPMVIVDVQRGGPSTGLPTKTEQADLLLAMFGRNGESPLPIVAAQSPADCFYMAMEAMRIAVEFMVPVIFLTDGYVANGAEPWRIPELSELKPIEINHPTEPNGEDDVFLPYKRNEKLVRPWVKLGTPGLEHRIGGIEKAANSGHVSYDPDNHEAMVRVRAAKIDGIADYIPEQKVDGPESGEVLAISWGGTFGAVRTAARELQAEGKAVSHAHLQYLNPFPRNLGDIISRFKKVLVPELNMGQLRMLLRDKYLVDAKGLNKIKGKPFLVSEVVEAISDMLD
ncbi:MAG: 2-oxoacid:acceptor oxidoreductase subunit alpha [Planctomycetota bacterium]|nr:2-oxoacid:acceptor oxidoreductase subunit alpha [Planctomycetota bacterium]MDA1250813.1 2-oxoacid:acceptor oxidoreductase subunit alpha [Planctomycetota bacterium]